MISFTQTAKSYIIAMFIAYHKKHNQLVFYSKDNNKNHSISSLNDDDLLKLLQLQYGKTKTRYKKALTELPLQNDAFILNKPVRGEFIPLFIPVENQRFVHAIFGASGSGKSMLAKKLSKYYARYLKCYLITPVPDKDYNAKFVSVDTLVTINSDNDYDKQLKLYNEAKIKLKYKKKMKDVDDKILMELELMVNDMKPKKTKANIYKLTDEYHKLTSQPSLMIFDDTEATPDQAKLQFLQDQILLTGRHKQINMIVIHHQANNGHKTRNLINESNLFTVFDINHYTSYFLEKYLKFTKHEVKSIDNMIKDGGEHTPITIYKKIKTIVSPDCVVKF